MRISDWSSDVCSSDLRKSTDTAPRFCGKPPMRISVKARKRIGQPEMNTLDCSPMVFNGLSSWFLRENQVDDGEALIGGSDTDDQEGAWLEPGSLLGRVQPYLHEFAGARPEKHDPAHEIGRASWRERGCQYV